MQLQRSSRLRKLRASYPCDFLVSVVLLANRGPNALNINVSHRFFEIDVDRQLDLKTTLGWLRPISKQKICVVRLELDSRRQASPFSGSKTSVPPAGLDDNFLMVVGGEGSFTASVNDASCGKSPLTLHRCRHLRIRKRAEQGQGFRNGDRVETEFPEMTGMRGSVAVARIPARSDRWLLSDAALKFRAPAGSLHVR